MRFHVITLFPDLITAALKEGVVGQAIASGKIEIKTYNPRKWTSDVHHSVDDRPFGGGDGMVMLPEPLDAAMSAVSSEVGGAGARNIYLSARGRPFNDAWARELAETDGPDLVLLCGRYGGVDQRLLEKHRFEELTLGDFVLSGGEFAALAVIDAVGRLQPGVLGNAVSSKEESFANGWLEYPQFTRPREWGELIVPEILFSGHHAKIQTWRGQLSLICTAEQRPDLLRAKPPSPFEARAALQLLSSMTPDEAEACGIRDARAAQVCLKEFTEARGPR